MTALTVGGAAPESTVPWQHTNPLAGPACQPGPPVREVVTWELAQKYFLDPTFGGALIPGQRNVFTTTADLTGIAFLTSLAISRHWFRGCAWKPAARTDAEWDMDYDFQGNRVNASTLLANYHISAR
jgi:hypothetical protein